MADKKTRPTKEANRSIILIIFMFFILIKLVSINREDNAAGFSYICYRSLLSIISLIVSCQPLCKLYFGLNPVSFMNFSPETETS